MKKIIKKSKLQGQAGETNTLITITLFMITIFNIADQVIKGQNLIERISYTAPYLFLGALIYLLKSKKIKALIYFLIGSITISNSNFTGDYSSVVFFFLFFIQYPNKKTLILSISIMCIGLTFRSELNIESLRGLSFMLLIHLSIFAGLYLELYKEKPSFKDLSKDENEILLLISKGKSQKEAGFDMGLDTSQASELIKSIKKKLSNDSLYSIIFDLGQSN